MTEPIITDAGKAALREARVCYPTLPFDVPHEVLRLNMTSDLYSAHTKVAIGSWLAFFGVYSSTDMATYGTLLYRVAIEHYSSEATRKVQFEQPVEQADKVAGRDPTGILRLLLSKAAYADLILAELNKVLPPTPPVVEPAKAVDLVQFKSRVREALEAELADWPVAQVTPLDHDDVVAVREALTKAGLSIALNRFELLAKKLVPGTLLKPLQDPDQLGAAEELLLSLLLAPIRHRGTAIEYLQQRRPDLHDRFLKG